MKPETLHSDATRRAVTEPKFPPLEAVTCPTVPTPQAAYYLNRRAQTLRGWCCQQNGPIRAKNVHGRLAWPVADIRRLLGVEGAQ